MNYKVFRRRLYENVRTQATSFARVATHGSLNACIQTLRIYWRNIDYANGTAVDSNTFYSS